MIIIKKVKADTASSLPSVGDVSRVASTDK